jgi:hypothetical protein
MNPRWATLFAGLSLVIPVWIGPQLLSNVVFFIPDTALTGVSWFWLCIPFGDGTASLVLAQFVPMILFFVWNPRLLLGVARVPKRSYALFAVATILTVLYFRSGWSDGMSYQGSKYTNAFLGGNVASIALLGLLFARNRKREPSFSTNLLIHWSLFAWLAWFAFPFLGAPTWP